MSFTQFPLQEPVPFPGMFSILPRQMEMGYAAQMLRHRHVSEPSGFPVELASEEYPVARTNLPYQIRPLSRQVYWAVHNLLRGL
jgi:hypothetical protein